MMKNWNRMGKGLMFVLVIAAVSLFVCCMVKMNRMQVTLNELMSQLFYLQDSAAVLQSDMGTMETNLEAAFKEETSLIEDYSITVTDCDFSKGTYGVDITVLPKEYTETTQLTIYFGTKAYNLELSGISFKGTATLSMANNYDGNVTVLFTNGEKRSTEVLSNYKDFQTMLKQSVSGSVAGVEDSYRDGIWEFDGEVDYNLNGQNSFAFESFHLVAQVGDTTVYDYDLIRETGGAIELEPEEEENSGDELSSGLTGDGSNGEGLSGSAEEQIEEGITGNADGAAASAENETADADTDEESLSFENMDIPSVGTTDETFAMIENYVGAAADAELQNSQQGNVSDVEPQNSQQDAVLGGESQDSADITEAGDEEAWIEESGEESSDSVSSESISGTSGTQTMAFNCPAAETDNVRIYLTAVTTDGITLELTLFEGTLKSSNEIRIAELTTYTPVMDYYDKKHVKY